MTVLGVHRSGIQMPASVLLAAACLLALFITSPIPVRAQNNPLVLPQSASSLSVQRDSLSTNQLQPNVLQNLPARRLQQGVYQVDREAFSRIRTGEMLSSVQSDSVRLIVTERGESIEEITERLPERADSPALAGRTAVEDTPAARPAPQDVRRKRYRLPYEAVGISNGRVTGHYQPIIEVPAGGLELVERAERYRGTLYIGVQDAQNPAVRRNLPEAIDFQVVAEGGQVEPSRVPVRHTHIPFETVTVEARDVRDSVRLTIWTSLSPNASQLPIGIRRPSIRLRSVPADGIPGFGLGTARLTVELNRLGTDTAVVSLVSRRGNPTPENIVVANRRVNRATIRSKGLGTDTVTATLGGYNPGVAVVHYVFPWSFLIATLVGGLAGSGLGYLQAGGSRAGRSFWREATGGLLAATIIAVAYTVGVNLMGVSFAAEYGEALFFTLAALGAYGWRALRLPT